MTEKDTTNNPALSVGQIVYFKPGRLSARGGEKCEVVIPATEDDDSVSLVMVKDGTALYSINRSHLSLSKPDPNIHNWEPNQWARHARYGVVMVIKAESKNDTAYVLHPRIQECFYIPKAELVFIECVNMPT